VGVIGAVELTIVPSTWDYKDRGLQVITRILGVDLTPDNPTFETDWHVEGNHVRAADVFVGVWYECRGADVLVLICLLL
jgi:hypothetical protein